MPFIWVQFSSRHYMVVTWPSLLENWSSLLIGNIVFHVLREARFFVLSLYLWPWTNKLKMMTKETIFVLTVELDEVTIKKTPFIQKGGTIVVGVSLILWLLDYILERICIKWNTLECKIYKPLLLFYWRGRSVQFNRANQISFGLMLCSCLQKTF